MQQTEITGYYIDFQLTNQCIDEVDIIHSVRGLWH